LAESNPERFEGIKIMVRGKRKVLTKLLLLAGRGHKNYTTRAQNF
jgi:hypothetical protein